MNELRTNYKELMGKLTIDEKAQAYDEALEIAKSCLKDGTITNTAKSYIEEIFPELKDDDKRIREEILSLVKYTKGRKIGYEPHVNQDEMIAWLEKQGEKQQYTGDDNIRKLLIRLFTSNEN